MKFTIPVEESKETVSLSFGRTDGFLVVTVTDDKVKSTEYIKNSATEQSGGAGIMAAQLVVDQGVDALITPRCGDNAAKVIKSADIKIYKTKSLIVKDEIEHFLSGELDILEAIHPGMHQHK